MKYSKTEEPLDSQRIKYITERWAQLNQLSKETLDRSSQYLTLTNAGGAAAMLGFLGTNREIRDLLFPRLALACFGLGIIFVGLFHARFFSHVARIHANWRKSTRAYYNDELDWEDMIAEDDRISYTQRLEYFLGYSAFALFIVGALIGMLGLFNFWSAASILK